MFTMLSVLLGHFHAVEDLIQKLGLAFKNNT